MRNNILCRDILIQDCVVAHGIVMFFHLNFGLASRICNLPTDMIRYLEQRGYAEKRVETNGQVWRCTDLFYDGDFHKTILFYWKVYNLDEEKN